MVSHLWIFLICVCVVERKLIIVVPKHHDMNDVTYIFQDDPNKCVYYLQNQHCCEGGVSNVTVQCTFISTP